jgi:hypothetical protein
MIKLVSTRLWSHIMTLSVNTRSKSVAVAYISDDSRIQFGKGDLLIVDASDDKIASGDTSAEVLARAKRRGARIYSLQNLHAKLMVFDDVAIIGSANISKNSYGRLFEAGVITDLPAVVKQTREAIERLKSHAEPVNRQFIRRIQAIPVSVNNKRGGRRTSTKVMKPSLLDALRNADPHLNDFVIGFWEDDLVLSNSQVKAEAKRRGVKLPPDNSWCRYEESTSPKVNSVYSEIFEDQGRKLISFQVKSKEAQILKVVSIDPYTQQFVTKLKISRLLETIFLRDRRPPFRLDNPEAKELCTLLTQALRKNPQIARRMYTRSGWIFSPQEISSLLSAV